LENTNEPRDFYKEAAVWLKPPKPLAELVKEDKDSVIQILLGYLKDGGDYDRKYAAFVLGQIGDDSILDELRFYLSREQKKGIQEAIGAAIIGLLDAPASKGFSEFERRKIIDAAYDKNPLKFSENNISKDNSKSASSKSGCFIATATYGSSLSSEVVILQKFRDDFLLQSCLGIFFIKNYYKYSPPLANIISKHNLFRWLIKNIIIKPILLLLKKVFKYSGE